MRWVSAFGSEWRTDATCCACIEMAVLLERSRMTEVTMTCAKDARCPFCGGDRLTFGYGFAGGGGIGSYSMCLECDRILAKDVDVRGESLILPPPGPDDGELE